MKPIAIIQFSKNEAPTYLEHFLFSQTIPVEIVRVNQGEPIHLRAQNFSGIAMMGGPMSVNDSLAWLPSMLALIQHANDQDIPMIGHCLGAQLMSKALGGMVTDNKCHEMGWQDVEVVDPVIASDWLGDIVSFSTFQWHYQTFSIPDGATAFLRNDFCENQAYAIGKHIGFQCHIEMTSELVNTWCEQDEDKIHSLEHEPSVQGIEQMMENLDEKVEKLNQIAHRIYSQWITELKV